MLEEIDAAHCPFCGRDAADWDVDICEHLIADYGDGSNDDEGILGESRCGNGALTCLESLRDALLEFARLFADPAELEDAQVDVDRDEVVQAACPDGPVPIWLISMLDYFSGGSAIHWTVRDIFDQTIAWDDSLVQTQSIMGGIGLSAGSTYVWAKAPAVGAQQVADAIVPITAAVNQVAGRLGRGVANPDTDS